MAPVEERADRGPDEVTPPVRLTVECPSCGHVSTTLALHTGHIALARNCGKCAGPTNVVAAQAIGGAGCACCW
jgi:ribosomal protein S27AE